MTRVIWGGKTIVTRSARGKIRLVILERCTSEYNEKVGNSNKRIDFERKKNKVVILGLLW
jgi:hypothetical protein